MFGRRISLFSLFGFKVKLDVTWFILAILIAWSLATGVFPQYFPGFKTETYWWMGIAGAMGLFVSIVFHEFCHSIVARYYGLSMKGITLFIFGGVAEMEDEPQSPKVEFLMALAGPVSSVLLSGVFYLLEMAGKNAGWPQSVNGVLAYLAWINLILAGFNLVPCLSARRRPHTPLDSLGSKAQPAMGHTHSFISWLGLRDISNRSGNNQLYRRQLHRRPVVLPYWNVCPVSFPDVLQTAYNQKSTGRRARREVYEARAYNRFPDQLPYQQLVQDYFYKYHYKMFPVLENGRVKGCISTREVKQIPHDQWSNYRVADIVKPCSRENTVSLHEDAIKALGLMSSTGNSRLMVLDGDKLAGIVTLKDLLQFLALKIDLEENEEINIPY